MCEALRPRKGETGNLFPERNHKDLVKSSHCSGWLNQYGHFGLSVERAPPARSRNRITVYPAARAPAPSGLRVRPQEN
jgi:hypothetical protein